jgi:hypothetical protein
MQLLCSLLATQIANFCNSGPTAWRVSAEVQPCSAGESEVKWKTGTSSEIPPASTQTLYITGTLGQRSEHWILQLRAERTSADCSAVLWSNARHVPSSPSSDCSGVPAMIVLFVTSADVPMKKSKWYGGL